MALQMFKGHEAVLEDLLGFRLKAVLGVPVSGLKPLRFDLL